MYDYRRMNAGQRAAVVKQRELRNFPLHAPPHLDFGGGWYFISAACFEHRHHFSAPNELTALERRILGELKDADVSCAGWVILPNHYHLLVDVDELATLGRALGRVHGRSSYYANGRDGTPGRRVWYRYGDRKIRSDRHFATCLHYLFLNPVKHGFVEDPRRWCWSSLPEWLRENGEERFEQLRLDYPLHDFGRGWDD